MSCPLLIYRWLELPDGLGQDVAVGQVFVEDAKDLVVEGLVHANTLNRLLDGLEGSEKWWSASVVMIRERERDEIGNSPLPVTRNLVLVCPLRRREANDSRSRDTQTSSAGQAA